MTKWAFSVTRRKNFPKQTYPRHFSHRKLNTQKRSKFAQNLLRCTNRIHMLSDSLSCVVEIAAFSLVPIYHRNYRLSSATTCQFICAFLPSKTGPGGWLQGMPARLQTSLWRSRSSRQSIRRPSPFGDPYSFFRGSVPFHCHPTVSNGGRTSTETVAWVLDLAL